MKRAVVSILLSLYAATALAQDPRWEAGMGVGSLYLPDYRGSDQAHLYVVPWPYIVYYGNRVALDREGLRARFSWSPRVSIVASVGAATPVNSQHNEARAGMPDLDFALEVGPMLEIDLWRGEARKRVALQLPVRYVIATTFSRADYIGWLFAPRVILHVPYFHRWDIDAAAGLVYGSNTYHDYYYTVAPAYATPTRPVYEADAGYSGSRFTLGGSTRRGPFWIGGYVRYDNLSNTVFRDSPLVRTDNAFVLGGGIAYVFLRGEDTHYHE